jgi:NAD(P)H-hydrate epimerase
MTKPAMPALPLALYTAAQVRALDRHAIETHGIPAYTLMERAGAAAARTLSQRWPHAERVLLICGSGNNGGDGYVLARLLRARGLTVEVLALADPAALRGDARTAYRDYVSAGGGTVGWGAVSLAEQHVIVDGIFGTGLSRPLDGRVVDYIDAINDCGVPILALDIPSGLGADTGRALGAAVRADCTVSFVGLKLGCFVEEGPDFTGDLYFDDLGIADVAGVSAAPVTPAAYRIDPAMRARVLPRRRRSAHKGQQGHILVIGGGIGMGGAARLAAEAALRVGAGLVSVATRPENVAAIVSGRPELMCRGISAPEDVTALIDRADWLVVGPGLGQDSWSMDLFALAMRADKPVVVDADGLNLLAAQPSSRSDWVLTPHPGEAGRLLGRSTAEVQADRLAAATELAHRYGGVAVLKGAGSLVAASDGVPHLCSHGNPGMATPGMGDVLSGIIAGIAAQTSLDKVDAVRVAVLIHAMAGDKAAERGERGLIASDVLAALQSCVNPE